MTSSDENDVANSESSQHAASRSSAPLVRKPPPSRPTLLARLSRTMSQIFEPGAPPPTSLAPPASPQSDHEADTELSSPLSPAFRSSASVASLSSPSTLPPHFFKRLKVRMDLENSGSVARDHLASERTFLAYVRTSLAVASTGVALVQLFTISAETTTSNKLSFIPTSRRVQAWARPLGATMVCFGLVILALGTIRYFRIQTALVKGMYPVARLTAASITFVLGTIIIVIFAVMLSARS